MKAKTKRARKSPVPVGSLMSGACLLFSQHADSASIYAALYNAWCAGFQAARADELRSLKYIAKGR